MEERGSCMTSSNNNNIDLSDGISCFNKILLSILNIFQFYYDVFYFHLTPLLIFVVIIYRNGGFEDDLVENVDFV
jgi:hypothetical protein